MPDHAAAPSAETYVTDLVGACVAYDPAGVRGRLDDASRALGLGHCLDNVLFPALREIGRRWQQGHLDIEAERLSSEAVRGWLEALAHQAPGPSDAAPLILTCGPADLHSIGLEALGVLLRHQGHPCRVLGGRVPVRTLSVAVRASRPPAVVVVSHLRANRLSATQSLRAAAAMGPDVFYAGGAFSSARQRRHVPGTHLDTTLQGACALILATTGPPSALG